MAHAIAEYWNVPKLTDLVESLLAPFRAQHEKDTLPFSVNAERISYSYDDESDVLYIRFGNARANRVDEWNGVVFFWRKNLLDRKPALLGVTVMDASRRKETLPLVEDMKAKKDE